MKQLVYSALLTLFLQGTQGALVENAIVTASSIYTADSNYALPGLIDNVFRTRVLTEVKKCAHTGVPETNTATWLNIQFQSVSVIQTALIVNREDCCPSRIQGSDLYVGNDVNPAKNIACNANPMRSGVYSCGGLSGLYLGLLRLPDQPLNVCQIRAFSLQANQQPYTLTSSLETYGNKDNVLTFPDTIVSNINSFVTLTNPGFWQMTFSQVRFIEAVVVVGHYYSDYAETKGFSLYYSDESNIEQLVYASADLDRFGREISVKQFGLGVTIRKETSVTAFSLYYVGIFTTITNCGATPTIVWDSNNSAVTSATQLGVGVTLEGPVFALANNGDCPLAHKLTVDGFTILPQFISYNTVTKILSLKPTLPSEAGIYALTLTASISDGSATPLSDSISFSLTVVFPTLAVDPATSFSQKKLELIGSPLLFALPSFTHSPASLTVNLVYSATSPPAFFQIVASDVVIGVTATPQTLLVQMRVTDSISGAYQDFSFTLWLYTCVPPSFVLTPSNASILTTFPQISVTMVAGTNEPECGSYTAALVDPTYASMVTISTGTLLAGAAYNAPVGVFDIGIAYKRDSNSAQQAVATLNLTVATCTPSVAMTAIANNSVPAEKVAFSKPLLSLKTAATYCVEEVTFELALSGGSLQPWISQNPSNPKQITIGTIPIAEAGTTYTYTVTSRGLITGATDKKSFTVYAYDCSFHSMWSSPVSVEVRRLGPAVSFTSNLSVGLSFSAANCGYSVSTWTQTVGHSLSVTGGTYLTAPPQTYIQTWSITASLAEPLGQVDLTRAWTGSGYSPVYNFQNTMTVNVLPCQVTSFGITNGILTNYYLIASSAAKFSFPTFTQSPACTESVSYVVTSDSPMVTSDTSLKQIFVLGTDVSLAGSKTVTITATATFSNYSSQFLMPLQIHNCTPQGMLATPSSLKTTQLAHKVGINIFALLSKTAAAAECGTFSYSIATNPAPPFITLVSNQITFRPTLDDKVGTVQLVVKETNNLVPLSALLTIPLTIDPCKIYTMPQSSSVTVLPKSLIIDGPPLPVTLPGFNQMPACKYPGLYKDTALNFDLTEDKTGWQIAVSTGTTFGTTKALKPRAYFKEDVIFTDLDVATITVIKVTCDKLLDYVYVIPDAEDKAPAEKTVNMIDLQALFISPDIVPSQLRFNITLADGKPLPAFITFNQLNAVFSIKVDDKQLAADYFISIAVDAPTIHAGWSCKFATWKLTVEVEKVNKAIPVLNKLIFSPAPEDQEVKPGDDWTFAVPTPVYLIVDKANDISKIKLQVSFSLSAPIRFEESTKQLVLMRPVEESDVGLSVVVKYTLSDGTLTAEFKQTVAFKPKQVSDTQTASVPAAEKKKTENPFAPFDPSLYYSGTPTKVKETQTQEVKKKRPLSIDIKTINKNGQIFVSFSEPLVVPLKYLNLGKQMEAAKNSTNTTTSQERRLDSLEESIQVRVIPGSESSVSNLTYTWNVTSFTENDLTISVYFDNAKYVSVHEDLDSVQVIFLDLNLFVAQSGAVLDKPLSLIQVLPRQMQPDSAEVSVANAATSASTGVKSFVIGNVIMSTVLSASLNMLFQMVEAQQIVCLITCSQITLPPLPATIVAQFFQIANFDILNVFYVYEKIFYMPTIPAINPNFSAVGFSDTYFINNLGSIILSIIGFLGLQGLSVISRKFKKKSPYIKEKWHGIQPTCFWHMPIQVIMTSYSIMALSALMTLRQPQWHYPGPIIDTCCGLLGLVVTIVFPFIVLYLMITKFEEFNLKTFQKRFGSLTEGLDLTNKWIIGYRIWFLLRRMLLAIIVVYTKTLTIQILLWFLQEIITLVILGYGYPFEFSEQWRSEMWNEVFILSTIYFTMFFSPYISNVDILNGLGYCFVGILFFHLLVNIVKIAIVTVIQKTKEFKQWLIIQKEKKRVNKLMSLRNKKKQQEMAKKFTQRRRSSMWQHEGENSADKNQQKTTVRNYFAFGLKSNQDEELGLSSRMIRARKGLGRKVLPIDQTELVLEQIEEENASKSSSSYYSDNSSSSYSSSSLSSYYSQESEEDAIDSSDDYAINHGEEEKEEESMTLNDIGEEEVKVAVRPFLKHTTQIEGGKKEKNLDDVFLLCNNRMEEVFSDDIEQHFDGTLRVLKRQNESETPFASASSFVSSSNPSKQIKKMASELVISESTVEEKKETKFDANKASLGQLINIVEADRNSRYDQTDKESELMRDLSESRLAVVNYDYEENYDELLNKKQMSKRVKDQIHNLNVKNFDTDMPFSPVKSERANPKQLSTMKLHNIRRFDSVIQNDNHNTQSLSNPLSRRKFITSTLQNSPRQLKNIAERVPNSNFEIFKNHKRMLVVGSKSVLPKSFVISERSIQKTQAEELFKTIGKNLTMQEQFFPYLQSRNSAQSSREINAKQHKSQSPETRQLLDATSNLMKFYNDYKDDSPDKLMAKLLRKNAKMLENNPQQPHNFVGLKRKIDKLSRSLEHRSEHSGRNLKDLLRAQTLGKLILNQKPSILDKSGLPSARNRSYVSEERKQ